MTTLSKTLTALAAALVLMTAVSAQARQSDFVPTSEITGPTDSTQSSSLWEQNLNKSSAL